MSNAVFPSLPGLQWDVKMRPRFETMVQTAKSGKEIRAAFMQYPIWEFDVSFSLLRSGAAFLELQTLAGFFNSRQGKFDTWLYDNPLDDAITAQQIGVGNGSVLAYQLTRTFGGFTEPVQNVNGSPQIFVNDWQGNQLQFASARTNLVLQSEDLSTSWGPTNVTISTNTTVAPDGNTTADSILETAVSATHFIQQNFTKAASALPYTLKFWCKPINGRNTFRAQINDQGANAAAADIDMGAVTAGVVGSGFTGVTASIVAAPNSTFLVTIQGTSNSLTTLSIAFQITNPAGTTSYLGDVTKGIVIWGIDLKQSAVASSYIKTLAAAVTVTDYALSTLGIVTFAIAPALAALISWTGSYYYRCRFMDDISEFNNFMNQLWENKKLSFLSVKL